MTILIFLLSFSSAHAEAVFSTENYAIECFSRAVFQKEQKTGTKLPETNATAKSLCSGTLKYCDYANADCYGYSIDDGPTCKGLRDEGSSCRHEFSGVGRVLCEAKPNGECPGISECQKNGVSDKLAKALGGSDVFDVMKLKNDDEIPDASK